MLKLDRYTIYLPAGDGDDHTEHEVEVRHVDRLAAEKAALALGVRTVTPQGEAGQPIAFMTLQLWNAAKRLGYTRLGPQAFMDQLIDFDEIEDEDADPANDEDAEGDADPTEPGAHTG